MEDFVPFETAKKLKEKGFKTENTDWCYLDGNLVQVKKYVNISPYEYAPTISQVLKWLRKEKQVDILTDILIKYDSNLNRKRQYTAKILTPKLNKPIYVCSIYNYEKALISAIEYCLDNLI